MGYSGAWLASNGPYSYVNMQRVHTADPRHADTSVPDENAPTYTAPAGVAQSGFGLPDDEWMGGQGRGVTLEYSPQEHDLGLGEHPHVSDEYIGASGLGGGELTRAQETAKVHGVSYGADIRGVYTPSPMQYADERYGSIRSDGIGPTLPPGYPTGYRGTWGNSSRENNPPTAEQPDGYRLGSDLWVYLDRKFHTGQRYHDRHIVGPNDADAPTNQTRGVGHSMYLSPYDTAKRAITRAFNTPSQLVSPPDFSTDITEDAPETETVSMPDWAFA